MTNLIIKVNLILFLIVGIFIFSCKKKIITNTLTNDTEAFECEQQFFSKLHPDEKPATDIIEIANNTYILNSSDYLTKTDSLGNIISQIYLDNKISYITKTNNGNLILCIENEYGGNSLKIMKTDTLFNEIWSFFSDYKFLITTNDNGCIIIYDKNAEDICTVSKYNANGNKDWSFDVEMIVNDIIQVNNNEYVFAGYANNRTAPCLLKTDSTGSIIWKKIYTELFDNVYAITNIVELSSGKIICVLDASRGTSTINFFATDNKGDVLWKSTLTDDVEYNDIVGNGDNFIICTKEVFDKTRFDFVLTEYNVGGNIVWKKNYGGTGYEELNDIKLISGNSFIISASSTNFIYSTNNTEIIESMYLIKIDNNGETCY